jgi:hypothetical protein
MKTAHRSRVDAVLAVLMTSCGVPLLLQLVAIPASFMLIKPTGLECAFYGASRAGWGCAKLADVLSNPLPTVLGLAAVFTLFLCFRLGRADKFPWRYLLFIVAGQALFVCGLALLLRTLAVIFGRAHVSFLIASLPMVAIALIALLFLRSARPIKSTPTVQDEVRRNKQAQTSAVEIAERSAALRNRERE